MSKRSVLAILLLSTLLSCATLALAQGDDVHIQPRVAADTKAPSLTDDASRDESGNDETGEYVLTEGGTRTADFAEDGTDAGGSFLRMNSSPCSRWSTKACPARV